MCVIVLQVHICVKISNLYILTYVQFIICELYLSKSIKITISKEKNVLSH